MTAATRYEIGSRIREIRESLGLSQVELAEKLGTSQGNIARIELGKYSTTVDNLGKIAEALGVRIELIKVEEDRK